MNTPSSHLIPDGRPFAASILCTLGVLLAGCSKPADDDEQGDPNKLLEERGKLDQTVWADEVDAQRHEEVFVGFWDRLRNADAEGKFEEIAKFPFSGKLSLPGAGEAEQLEHGISLTEFGGDATPRSFSQGEWSTYVRSIREAGIKIVQTEWHHSRFVPERAGGPTSTISFAIHAIQPSSRTTFTIKGDLEVSWETSGEGARPQAESIAVTHMTVQKREGGGLFRRLFTAEYESGQFASTLPVLVYDLDGDALSEIILPRWNRVYWNRGGRRFEQREFLDHPIKIWETGILSDFNGDGEVDFVTVGKDGVPYLFAGAAGGRFPSAAKPCADVPFEFPSAITAGDADGDGDLDLWMSQYKLSFNEGQMPTPFYDANDGYPTYFLLNNGDGSFVDQTEAAGLGVLRNRRTYSCSFVDLDRDGDLDLINVSDYAGLDIYENAGGGKFSLATERFVGKRHFFGMGHTFGDYNADGLLDFYVIGMSSTTARRLDRLGLGREERPDIHAMRAEMGFGNRLFLGTPEGKFVEDPDVGKAVARTGWSWGTTSFDFDIDGDQDIYVANGHRSGKSCQDYCSVFWRHDIYTGDSVERPEIDSLFKATLREINTKEISWNGYEKNVLFVHDPDRKGRFTNSAFLFNSAFAFDARSVVADDLDADGRPDLIVGEWIYEGAGVAAAIHVFGNNVELDTPRHWFGVSLRESPGGASPNGAKVTLEDVGGRIQTRWIVTGDSFLAQHAPVAHFGLGEVGEVKSVTVTWANGVTEVHDVKGKIDTTIVLKAGDGQKTR